ncbi:hypothetical protein EP47_04825 [Legionella norrlandica]|uniref:Flagellar hook-length control protein-like C-terminal domain-containing protein n=1 Tax=Legionella norrlandica TaxID=1498499 RepID=A0A0A2SW58_9GAMM|nr:flagellar hook-length control protein FliK [Legionella norrlandica]KGP63689.1 hypothetical protein EP47_04825 [Legionella norrlandica]
MYIQGCLNNTVVLDNPNSGDNDLFFVQDPFSLLSHRLLQQNTNAELEKDTEISINQTHEGQDAQQPLYFMPSLFLQLQDTDYQRIENNDDLPSIQNKSSILSPPYASKYYSTTEALLVPTNNSQQYDSSEVKQQNEFQPINHNIDRTDTSKTILTEQNGFGEKTSVIPDLIVKKEPLNKTDFESNILTLKNLAVDLPKETLDFINKNKQVAPIQDTDVLLNQLPKKNQQSQHVHVAEYTANREMLTSPEQLESHVEKVLSPNSQSQQSGLAKEDLSYEFLPKLTYQNWLPKEEQNITPEFAIKESSNFNVSSQKTFNTVWESQDGPLTEETLRKLTLHINQKELGDITAKIEIIDKQSKIYFFTETNETKQLIQHHVSHLKEIFNNAELQLVQTTIQYQSGKQDNPKEQSRSPSFNNDEEVKQELRQEKNKLITSIVDTYA